MVQARAGHQAHADPHVTPLLLGSAYESPAVCFHRPHLGQYLDRHRLAARSHSHRGLCALPLRPGSAGALCPAHVKRQFPRLPWAGQRYAALLGALLFSTNFLCFYHATLYIPSGLSAVIFASASIFNGLNLWLFEGKRPGMRWLQGSLLGLMGTLLLFWPVLADAQLGANGWKGLLFACAGTLCFSLGNLVSARGQRQGYQVLQMVPWGMVYGVVLLLGWVMVLGQSLTLPTEPRYLAAMVYLAIFGSVIAFTAYLTLVGRIGASKAAYATVLFPLVALSLSTLYEGFVWQTVSILGVVVSLIGNLVIFAPPVKTWRWPLSRVTDGTCP